MVRTLTEIAKSVTLFCFYHSETFFIWQLQSKLSQCIFKSTIRKIA